MQSVSYILRREQEILRENKNYWSLFVFKGPVKSAQLWVKQMPEGWRFGWNHNEWAEENWGNWFPWAVDILFEHIFWRLHIRELVAGPYHEKEIAFKICLILGFLPQRTNFFPKRRFFRLALEDWLVRREFV